MTESIAFDTLKFAKHIVNSGFTQQQAEGLAEGLAEQQKALLDNNLATKVDLAQVEANLKIDLANLKTDMIRWNFGIMLAMAAIFFGIVKFAS